MFENVLNRQQKSIHDVVSKMGIKQVGISSITRSPRFISQQPVRAIEGKVVVPDIMALEKM